MSYVTNIILTASCLEDFEEDPVSSVGINELNDWLVSVKQPPLVRVDTMVAGPKCPTVCVWFQAFNYLDERAFLDAVEAAPWQDASDVQVFSAVQSCLFKQIRPATKVRESPVGAGDGNTYVIG
jgi:hypothetical protein